MTTVHSITGGFFVVVCFPIFQVFFHVSSVHFAFLFSMIQPPKRLSMDLLLRIGEVEELLHSTSFPAVLELQR